MSLNVTIYTVKTCADCQAAKSFFAENGIAYTEKPVEEERFKDELLTKYQRLATPTIVIEEQVFLGFIANKEAIRLALGIMASEAVDPVCGMTVEPKTAAGSYTYEGTTYYFCNLKCRDKFQAEPGKYLHSEAKAAPAPTPAAPKDLANTVKITLEVLDMSCASCVQTVEKALRSVAGVAEANVNFANEKAYITYNPQTTNPQQLIRAVVEVGYQARLPQASAAPTAAEELAARKTRQRLWLAWGLTIPIFLWMLPMMIWGIMWPSHEIFNWGQVLLATPVMFVCGGSTLLAALKAVRLGTANMEVLTALGTLAAYLTGVFSLFVPLENFSGVAAMIMAIYLVGRYLESQARGKTSQAIKKLLQLGSKTARITVGEGEREVPIEAVRVGDIMVIRPGEKIPTDGVIVAGEGTIDESMVTGESVPVHRKSGDSVVGATINQQGFLQVKAAKIGPDTFLAQVAKLVEECQSSKVPIQDLADRVIAYFVPFTLIIAALTLLSWLFAPAFMQNLANAAASFLPWAPPQLQGISMAVFAAVAVLVIACPCALGLATPTALMVSSGKGAEAGVLIRKGEAIELLKDIKTIVFDKTGTLTVGKPVVTDVLPAAGSTALDLLTLAASLEKGSEHPLALAVLTEAQKYNLTLVPPTKFTALAGQGIEGKIKGDNIFVGSLSALKTRSVDLTEWRETLTGLETEAKTVIGVAKNSRLLGFLAIADSLKEDSAAAILELQQMGITTVMLTGDNQRTAQAIARKLGISKVVAEVLPAAKLAEIKKLQAEYGRIAMVGDGINDAPALSQADVGLAIGSGTDIAIEAADVTLVRGNIGSVISAIKLSRATFSKIRQNLFWAFFYNVIAIPLAMLGLLHPAVAEAAMAFSSINVITNSLRLRRANIAPRP